MLQFETIPTPFIAGVNLGRAAFARGIRRCVSDDPAIAQIAEQNDGHLLRQGWQRGWDAACIAAHCQALETLNN